VEPAETHERQTMSVVLLIHLPNPLPAVPAGWDAGAWNAEAAAAYICGRIYSRYSGLSRRLTAGSMSLGSGSLFRVRKMRVQVASNRVAERRAVWAR
jgi:hypothetical protein